MAKRKIFAELMEGIAAMQARREGKITLRSGSKRNKRRSVLRKA